METQPTPEIPPRECPRPGCGRILLRSWDEYWCICGHTEEILPPHPPPEEIVKEILKPQRRLIGISPKESRRRYLQSPPGKAAIKRYHDSELFREAHARHRETEKYRETQKRFHDKRKLFRHILRTLNGPGGQIETPWFLELLSTNSNHCTRDCIFIGEQGQGGGICLIYFEVTQNQTIPLEPNTCTYYQEET